MRGYALVLGAFLVVFYAYAWLDVAIVHATGLINSAGTAVVGDYIAFHAAGRLVLEGQAGSLYDHAGISGIQEALLGGRIPNFYDAYRNPPFFALIYAPLALFDLLPGFALWSLLSLICLALAIKVLLDEVPVLRSRWRGLLIFVFAFPPVYFGLIDGENAFVSLLLYVLIYRALAHGDDVGAGVWSALGLFKPQLFFVFPLVLLVTRRWRGLAAYVGVASVLALISVAMVGPDGMVAWGRILLEPEGGNSTVNGWRMASVKSFFDSLLPGQGIVALVAYVLVGTTLVWAIVRTWTTRALDVPRAWALTCLVAVLVDPHLVDYDLTVLVAAAAVGAALIPRLLWAIVPLYVVTLLRAQLPLGDANLQLAAPLLAACALALSRERNGPAVAEDLDGEAVGAPERVVEHGARVQELATPELRADM